MRRGLLHELVTERFVPGVEPVEKPLREDVSLVLQKSPSSPPQRKQRDGQKALSQDTGRGAAHGASIAHPMDIP